MTFYTHEIQLDSGDLVLSGFGDFNLQVSENIAVYIQDNEISVRLNLTHVFDRIQFESNEYRIIYDTKK